MRIGAAMATVIQSGSRKSIIGSFLCLSFFSLSASASELKIIELFTSQSCYSCPAADELIAKIDREQANVLGLEFHVDYWNLLHYGSAGTWEDPYSKAEYTFRQRKYNNPNVTAIDQYTGVYTPQAVINGRYGVLGSDPKSISRGLAITESLPLSVAVELDDNNLSVSIEGETDAGAQVFLVRYLKETETQVTGGENNNKTMKNYNVVTDMQLLGTVLDKGGDFQLNYDRAEGEDCVVLVQPESQSAILGAALCPTV
jgi:hypothetical protein